MKKHEIEQNFGYYSFPYSGEPFNGTVVNLTKDEFKIFFEHEGNGDERKFRERLERMDNWFVNKPYKVQQQWPHLIAKWITPIKTPEETR